MCKLEGGWILADMKSFFFFFAQDVCLKANTLTWIFFKKVMRPICQNKANFFFAKIHINEWVCDMNKKKRQAFSE